MNLLGQLPGVESVVPIMQPNKLGREFKNEDTFKVGNANVGGKSLTLIAGPYSVESEKQIFDIAKAVKLDGATILRGGAFKPRTSPYTFQGLGEEGLKFLKNAGNEVGLPIVTEVLDVKDLDLICEYADMLQIGARNCQNYALLKEAGKSKKPVLLKRGMSTSLNEFLLCAEYLLAEGNMSVALCEGNCTLKQQLEILFINAIPVLKEKTHLPVCRSCAWDWILAVCFAYSLWSNAAGADGLAVEVHDQPEIALSDGGQSQTPKFNLMKSPE